MYFTNRQNCFFRDFWSQSLSLSSESAKGKKMVISIRLLTLNTNGTSYQQKNDKMYISRMSMNYKYVKRTFES